MTTARVSGASLGISVITAIVSGAILSTPTQASKALVTGAFLADSTCEPGTLVSLPAGAVQTSGPVISGNPYVAPATLGGNTLVFQILSGTITFKTLPHTQWYRDSGGNLKALIQRANY